MMEQIGEDGQSDVVQVLEMTATATGVDGEITDNVNLLDCEVIVEASPTQQSQSWNELFIKDGKTIGLVSVTIDLLDGESVEKLISKDDLDLYQSEASWVTQEDKEKVKKQLTVKARYTIQNGKPVVYAVRVKPVEHLTLTNELIKEIPFLSSTTVYPGQSLTIDLNGCKWSRKGSSMENSTEPFVYVHSGGSLTVIDSGAERDAPGGIYMSNAQAVFTILDVDHDEKPGEINIECGDGTVFQNDGGEHVIYTYDATWVDAYKNNLRSMVRLSGGKLTGGTTAPASPVWRGGGILAGTVEMSGGIICDNTAQLGGGIYANEVRMSGGTVEKNKSFESGGGVWAAQMRLYNGTIQNNTSCIQGGGVYAQSMLMTDGIISNNHVIGGGAEKPRGGGGIYIATNKKDGSEATIDGTIVYEDDGISFNMSVTGGTIENNTSIHVGGGIFVNVGSVVHIRGMREKTVHIEGNIAKNEAEGHGFAGGGIFVEHPPDDPQTPADEGGKVYIYNAVITGNSAKYGGGVAGCGSSSVEVCSVDGVAIYENTSTGTGEAEDERYASAKDLYCDGHGKVDSMMMGGIQGSWMGLSANNEDPQKGEFTSAKFGSGAEEFDHGFYLTAGGSLTEDPQNPQNPLTNPQKQEIERLATVVIKGNTSGSGGGGVGGNGFIKLGFRETTDKNSGLELKKIVSSPENETENGEFQFKIKFFTKMDNGQEQPAMKKQPYSIKRDGSKQQIDSGWTEEDGTCEITLGHNDTFKIESLPAGTHYKITEVLNDNQEDKYMPGIKVTVKPEGSDNNSDPSKWTTIYDQDGNEVSNWIGADTQVVFTNTAVYALPSTGGPGTKLYTMAGALCFMLGAGLMYRKKFRGRRV